MTRYKAEECYKYTGNQVQKLSPALARVIEKHQAIDMVNTTKKTSLDENMEGIKSGANTFVSALSNSSYTYT